MRSSIPFTLAVVLALVLGGSRLDAQCLPAPFEHWIPDSQADQASFGLEVGLSGPWAVVGSHREDDQAGNVRAGAVYVYRRDVMAGWSFHQKLEAPDGQPLDEFGFSVAIDGDTMVIGARRHGGGTKSAPGKAYVYALDSNGLWGYRVVLAGSGALADPVAGFGATVDISGDTIAIGAHRDSCMAQQCGAVYLFVRPGSSWPQMSPSTPLLETAKLGSDSPSHGERFGSRVAIDGGLLAVNGYHGTHLGISNAGLVYLFERPAGGWVSGMLPSAVLGSEAPSQYGEFGVALDVQENAQAPDVVVIGARSQVIQGEERGGAFAVEEPLAGWASLVGVHSVEANLLPSELSLEDHYGLAVAIDGSRIVVSAPLEDTMSGQDWGRAYVFQRVCDQWEERYWLEASSVHAGGHYPHLGGARMAIQGRTVLVGVHLEDTSTGTDSGAAHMFELLLCPQRMNGLPRAASW